MRGVTHAFSRFWMRSFGLREIELVVYGQGMSEQAFNGFDPRRAVRIYHGNLPHWRQAAGLYFVTFRLADSIPKTILAGWDGERRAWMEAHGIKGYPASPNWRKEYEALPEQKRHMFHRMNERRLFVQLNKCHGECWLKEKHVREVVVNSIFHFDGDRWRVGDFVVMPNHVHLLVSMCGGYELEKVLYSVKRFSARAMNAVLGRSGRVWQKEYYDHIVRDRAELCRIRKYIADNPRKAGLPVGYYGSYSADWMNEVVGPDSNPVRWC